VSQKQTFLELLGERIRSARKAKGLTQEELAHESEIDRSYIGGVERGERNLSFDKLCEIAKALDCDVAALTEGIPPGGKK
jgi:transcriptional regulator with XRE-family HTH domain